MVILTCQLIGNAVLAMIDPDRFRRGQSDFKSSSNFNKCQQCGASVSQNTNRLVDAVSEEKHEALLNLLEACDLTTLSRAVAKVLTTTVTSATGCAVYFKPLDATLHEDLLELYIGEREHVQLHPDNGSSIIWDAYHHGRTVCVNGWVVPESLFNVIRSNSWGYIRQETKVSCLPVQKDANSPVLAVLVVSHNEEWNQYDIWELSCLSKQLSACYNHIQRAFQGRGSRRTEESCSQALMKLCGELYDQDAGQLQLKVIKYLEEQTRSEVAFLVLVVPDTQELFCQVQGDHILEEEVRFPNSYFAAALETKKPIFLEDVPVDAQKEIEDLVRRPLNSLLCVPVTSKTSDQLIALACLINKKNGNKFTSDDITCIQQSFCYTSSVLTSTLAFQNERKLKNQTQAMLKVARHLFTNLGEFLSQCIHGDYDPFPRIHSMGCEIPISGKGIAGCIEVNKLKQINHSVILKRKSQSSSKWVSKELDNSFNRSHHSIKTLTSEIQRVYEEDQRRKSQVDPSTDMGSAELKEQLEEQEKLIFSQSFKHLTSLESQIKSRPNEIVTQESDHIEKDGHAVKTQKTDLDVLNPVSGSPCLTSDMDLSTQVADPGSAQPGENSSSTRLSTGSPSDVSTVGLDDDLEFSGSELDSTFISVAEDMEEHLSTKTDDADDLEKYFDAWSPLNSEMKSRCSYSDTAMIQDTSESIQDTSQSSVSMGLKESKCRLSKSDPSLNAILSSSSTDMKTTLNTAFLAGKSDPSVSVAVWQTSIGQSTSSTCQQDSQVTVVHVTDSGWHNRMRHKSTPISFSHSLQGFSMAAAKSDQQERTVHQYKSHIGSKSEPDILMSESLTLLRRIQFPVGDDYIWSERDLTKLLREVMQQARNLTQAERCSVFLIENETEELVAKVFDGITTNDEVQTEIRMPVTQGIAGHVATTGELLNIKDAYSHHLFYRGIDESTGFRTRNILCFPIKDENDVVLGVAQLCNKKTGPFFTAFDEEVATAFGIYCCIAISHSLMYTKVQEAQHRNKLANELMIYHMQVSDDDMKTLAKSEIPTPKKIDPDFDKFTYPPRMVPEFETLKSSISIVEDLGFISRWRIRKETLVRFLMMVKRGYRNPPYHNWMHAYSVGHFCYLLVKNLQLQNFLDDIEIFGLFVSCLCHDIDHRGTNNSFQVASQSILAALYSSEGSVMERHHFAQTMCILNTDGCNIFENLSSRDYQHVLDIVRDVILATDLAHHLRILKSLEAMAKEGYDKSSIKCHKLLLCLLMTACDLSDQTKKWENTKHIAALVYKEFFSQGDLEKAIGKEPIEMMDRERAKIPDLQISFLQHIAAPVYNLLSDLFPAAEPVSRAVKENCAHWEKIANKVKLRRGGSCAKMSIDQILALEIDDETDASKTNDKDNQQQSEVSENGCMSPVTLQDVDHIHTEQVGQG